MKAEIHILDASIQRKKFSFYTERMTLRMMMMMMMMMINIRYLQLNVGSEPRYTVHTDTQMGKAEKVRTGSGSKSRRGLFQFAILAFVWRD
jgi:hypothetical protein